MVEVFGIDSRIACIEVGRFQQAVDDQGYVCVECLFHLFHGDRFFQNRTIEQEGDDGSPFQADFRGSYQSGVYITDQSVDTIFVSPVTVECDNALHQFSHFPYVLFL